MGKLTKKYLDTLRRQAILSPSGWQLTNVQAYDDEYGNIKFKRSMEILNAGAILDKYEGDALADFINGSAKGSFNELISMLSDSLKDDIKDCTIGNYSKELDSTYITLIPLSNVSAFCFNKTEYKEPLDGNVICINQGMYFCLSLLGKSIVSQNVAGSLEQYNRNGAHEYNCAIKMFIRPNKAYINEIFYEHKELPAEVYGELSAYQSKVAMIILQFIALHEFGHIVKGDLDNSSLYSKYLNAIMSEDIIIEPYRVKSYWDMEYKADLFALKSLSTRSKSPLSAWANFTAIYLFFKWLSDIEKVMNKIICPYHPPPMERARYLEKMMILWYGDNESASEMCRKIDTQSDDWIKSIGDYSKQNEKQ